MKPIVKTMGTHSEYMMDACMCHKGCLKFSESSHSHVLEISDHKCPKPDIYFPFWQTYTREFTLRWWSSFIAVPLYFQTFTKQAWKISTFTCVSQPAMCFGHTLNPIYMVGRNTPWLLVFAANGWCVYPFSISSEEDFQLTAIHKLVCHLNKPHR